MGAVISGKPLTPAEQGRLHELEGVIKDNFLAYVAVGNALLEIRENRLYRNADGRTWERYCRELWDMSHRRADQLIAAKSVAENLGTVVPKSDDTLDWGSLPTSESQARELVGLTPEEQRQVWRILVGNRQATANSNKPLRLTAKVIRAAVNKYRGEQIVKQAKEATNLIANSPKSDYNKSDPFVAAFKQFVLEVANEAQTDWQRTSRPMVFDALYTLIRSVSESGRETAATRGLIWHGNNAEKLLAAGFSIFRLSADKLLIEQFVAVDQWRKFGEYQSPAQGAAAFADLMLEPGNVHG